MSFGGDDSLQTTGSMFSASFLSSNYLLRRIRNFGNSSDQQNQTIAESNHPFFDVENPIPMEMETAGSPTGADPEQESKRLKKLVPSASLAMAALCFSIYASIPAQVQQHPPSHLYYDILLAFTSLGVFPSLGLFMYTLLWPSGAEVPWFQKMLAGIAIAFILIAFVFRISLHFPVASSGHVWLLFFLVTAVIALLLYTAWKKRTHNQTARDPDVPI